MPPELKKSINSIEEMTCENCMFSVTTTEESYSFINSRGWKKDGDIHIVLCNHAVSMNIAIKKDFCSEGMWLTVKTWIDEDTGKEKFFLFIDDYTDLYWKFAKQDRGEE